MVRGLRAVLLSVLGLVTVAAGPAPAQVGGEPFGRNKVGWRSFAWRVVETDHLAIHFYAGEESLVPEVAAEAESAWADIAEVLGPGPGRKVPLLLYATHADMEQTNVYPWHVPEAVAGFAEPFRNRVVIPADLPADERYHLLRHELTHVFEFEILYAGSAQRMLRGHAPLWLMEGLASWLGRDETALDRMVIRDAVLANRVPSLRELDRLDYLTYRFGHAIFDWIVETRGTEGIRDLLAAFRRELLAGNVEAAVREALGIDVDTFDRRFSRWLRRRYLPLLENRRFPDEVAVPLGSPRPGTRFLSPVPSPAGELVAAIREGREGSDVVLLDARTGTVDRVLFRGAGHARDRLVSRAWRLRRDLGWSRDGTRLAFFLRRENHYLLRVVSVATGRTVRDAVLPPGLADPASPSFLDADTVVFSANRDGRWDLWRWQPGRDRPRRLTDDPAVDADPVVDPAGRRIAWVRREGTHDKLWVLEVTDPGSARPLTRGACTDVLPSFSRDGRLVYFSSARGPDQAWNLHRVDLDGGRIERLTDLATGGFSPAALPPDGEGHPRLLFTGFLEGSFRLFVLRLDDPSVEQARAAGEREDACPVTPERPFAVPLHPPVDVAAARPWRPRFDLDVPDVTLGVADDGTFLTATTLRFTDLFGDRRILVRADTYSDWSDLDVAWIDLSGRLDWAVRFRDDRESWRTGPWDPSSWGGEWSLTTLEGTASWPFSSLLRLEGTLGFARRRMDVPWIAADGSAAGIARTSDDYPYLSLDLVGDTVRWQPFGPWQGHRFRLGITAWTFVSGDRDGTTGRTYRLDFRGYRRITARSLVAFRLAGVVQSGEGGTLRAIGGLDELRGYRFREFVGDSAALAGVELRFPLLDAIRFPWGGRLGPVRGTIFLDAGAAWFEDALHVDTRTGRLARGRAAWDPDLGVLREFRTRDDDGRWRDLHGSAGVALRVPLLGLPCTWSFARRYDGKGLGSTRTDFYITWAW